MNKKSKHLITVFIMIFISLIFTGCANIEYSRISYSSGKVEDTFVVNLEKEKLQNLGVNYNSLVYDIENDLNTVYLLSVKLFKVMYLTEPNKTNEEKENIINAIEHSVTVEDNNIIAKIVFNTEESFLAYNNWLSEFNNANTDPKEPSETQDEKMLINKTIFLTSYNQSAESIFSNILSDEKVKFYDHYYNKFGKSTQKTINDVNFYQVLGTPNTRMKSNADSTFISNGVKVHKFKVDPLTSGKNMKFVTTIPNTTAWYITAIIVSVGFVVVSLIGAYLTQSIKKVTKR